MVIQVKDGGGLAWDGRSGNRWKWTHWEYVLEATMIAHVYWLDSEEKLSYFSAWGVVACKVWNASVDMTKKQLNLRLELRALPWLKIRLVSSFWRCYQNPSHLSFKNITHKKNIDRKSRPSPWALNVTDQAKERSQQRSWKRIGNGGRKVRGVTCEPNEEESAQMC